MRAARRQGVLGGVCWGTGPPLFHILFAAVINVAYTCLKADKDIMDDLVHMRKHKGAGGRGKAVRYPLTNALATSFCDVQYSHRRDLEAS